MKTILLVCDHPGIDEPLRRSLAHLVKCCDINIIHNGYQVFDELSAKAFDLIIIDFEIPGADSLELVESIQYIDPGVPVILMLKQEHQAIWDMVRHLKAQPIIRPFKPLTFLRLVDKLLHKQLNRYRYLAETLQHVLISLNSQTGATCTLLIDQPGQVLLSAGAAADLPLAALGKLAFTIGDESVVEDVEPHELLADCQQLARHALYVTPVIENLRLALLAPVITEPTASEAIWPWLDAAARQIKAILYQETAVETPGFNNDSVTNQYETAPPHWRVLLNLTSPEYSLQASPVTPEPADNGQPDEEIPVNWSLISDNNASLLSRLQSFCQVG